METLKIGDVRVREGESGSQIVSWINECGRDGRLKRVDEGVER